ncbi:MAG TPA: hypothetical protein VMV92_41535 [Streptosporangiaceae bacterium]|nr:hypothetical protein [Streptosporangiaceae bacterium]
MTYAVLPGAQAPVTPPVRKTPVSCCSYVCLMGTPFDWTCPGCGKTWEPPKGGDAA